MKRLSLALFLCLCALAPASANAAFGLDEFDVTFTGPPPPGAEPGELGPPVTQAGAHPYEMTTSLHFEGLVPTGKGQGGVRLEEAVKDILIDQVKGFVGNPTAVPRCTSADFLTGVSSEGLLVAGCPAASAVGVVSVQLASALNIGTFHGAIYNLEPPPGVAAKLGFWISGVPITLDLGVKPTPPYNVTGGPTNVSQVLEVVASQFTIWGTPADPRHDPLRGLCIAPVSGESLGDCETAIAEIPFLTLPRSCDGPLSTLYRLDSWQNPGVFVEGATTTHDATGKATGFANCGKLGFDPEVGVSPTTAQAESASGLDVAIDISDENLQNPEGIVKADIAAITTTLPVGMTLNPSAAEGLGVCTKAQYEAESLTKRSCPDAAKLGTIEAETPILENHPLRGSFYLARQDDPATKAKGAENPFDSLLATYIVIRDPELGVFVKLPGEVETDPVSGRILASFGDLPPFPLERVRVHLRSGPRAPLITPPLCGTHTTEVELTPSSGAKALLVGSSFQIASGPGGAPCPPGGTPPFDPGFEAGAANATAGAYAPFAMRIARPDGSQDLTKFSATLPPGLLGKLAGISKCPDAQIAAAKAKSGRQELASPSCPTGSEVGSVLAGAGVGTALTYVKGSLYLAGPYNGAPLSVAAIVPAVAGPFDVGTVVTRVALSLDPKTAQVEVDGSRSDPIPHILKGIPLKVRDVRVFAERPGFTLNPTSCEESATKAQLFGSGLDVFGSADDAPVSRQARFQASSCASLGFKPKLSFQLKGGTERGDFPALRATYAPRSGDANLEGLTVRLPRSAFLEQGHIRTICTRVQFAAGACPPGARYGFIKALTPLLEEPLEGPVYLRSSDHNLPDLVFDLHGLVDIEVATRIDSQKGGIRASIEGAPDAPISEVLLSMQGGRKGLIINSRDLCMKVAKASVQLAGQNGKASSAKPVMRAQGCGAKRKGKRRAG